MCATNTKRGVKNLTTQCGIQQVKSITIHYTSQCSTTTRRSWKKKSGRFATYFLHIFFFDLTVCAAVLDKTHKIFSVLGRVKSLNGEKLCISPHRERNREEITRESCSYIMMMTICPQLSHYSVAWIERTTTAL